MRDQRQPVAGIQFDAVIDLEDAVLSVRGAEAYALGRDDLRRSGVVAERLPSGVADHAARRLGAHHLLGEEERVLVARHVHLLHIGEVHQHPAAGLQLRQRPEPGSDPVVAGATAAAHARLDARALKGCDARC